MKSPSLTKKHFISLADAIKNHNSAAAHPVLGGRFTAFTPDQISALANFCREHNSAFNTERWHGYIAGTNGPSGGRVKPDRPVLHYTDGEGFEVWSG